MPRHLAHALLAGFLFLSLLWTASSPAETIVLPNTSANVDAGAASGASVLRDVFRVQDVYGAVNFPGVPIVIQELRFRPSAIYGSAFTATVSNIRITLSTTTVQPEALNATFDANHGTNKTVVIDGAVSLSSGFTGPSPGSKAFDIVFPLTTPFPYDSSQGNLLVDIQNFSGSGASLVDLGYGANAHASQQYAFAGNATAAEVSRAASDVCQIIFSSTAPYIVTQPQSQTAYIGGTATLTVEAGGASPLAYQWKFNGTNLDNATGPSLTISNLGPSDAGTYSVFITNAFGSIESAGAVLLVRSVVVLPNSSENVDAGAASGASVLRDVFRVQDVYGAANFPAEPIVIHELRFRPSAVYGHAFTSTVSNIRITFSTTTAQPGQLNPTFAANHGSNQTIVIDGAVACSSSFTGPSAGPKAFDIVLPLMTPFPYDPSQGNLLVDIQNFSGSGASLVDLGYGASAQASQQYAFAGTSTVAAVSRAVSDVLQIDFGAVAPAAPSIVTPPQSQTAIAAATVTFTVAVLGSRPLAYQWFFNNSPLADATNATLTLASVQVAQAGDYSVMVTNSFGSVTSQVATLTIVPTRTLSLTAPPAGQEGSTISVPIDLVSEGDVGGMTFALAFDHSYLRNAELIWSPLLEGLFNTVNYATPGQIRATFAFSGSSIPAGTQRVASVNFLLRSVPNDLDTGLQLQIQDVSTPMGDPILLGNQVGNTSARITQRLFLGDNNANQRLDVGDATVILRFLTGLDTARSWDTTGNDLNGNQALDSGDAIKVLRAAAGVDPQPGGGGGPAEGGAALRPASARDAFTLSPMVLSGGVNDLVTFQVQLQDVTSLVSGASFTLEYPTNALRLLNAQSYKFGAQVPAGALAVWNVAPAINNFATQSGRISLAVSTATGWPASNGVLAELTFQVQPGASNQYAWPLGLRDGEITADGYGNRIPRAGGATFLGRDPLPGTVSGARHDASGLFQFTLNGDAGASYIVEASSDLAHWTEIGTVLNTTGAAPFLDPQSDSFEHRFYRVRPAGN